MLSQEKKLARKLKIAAIKNIPLNLKSKKNNINIENDKTPTNIEKNDTTPTPT